MGSTPEATGQLSNLLRQLADPATAMPAAKELQGQWFARLQADIDADRVRTTAEREADDRAWLGGAIAQFGADADALISSWVDRYATILQEINRETEARVAALRQDGDVPDMDMDKITASMQLRQVLQAAGERIDPHLERIAAAFGTAGPHGDDWLPEAMHFAGPGLARVVPVLLGLLKARGVWSHPSRIVAALKRASEFDPNVVPDLRQLLNSENPEHRKSAASVLAALGDAAKPAAEELLASESGDEAERCGGLYALAGQRPPTAAALGVIERALRDANGYVRRAAVYAAGELRAAPGRFIPMLISACDDREFLHDETLPEAAVYALGKYGPPAIQAVSRLLLLLDGPIADRTVDPAPIRSAIQSITGQSPAVTTVAKVRPSPAAMDEPLFAVAHDGRLCYVDRVGAIVLSTPFDYGGPFRGDRAIVHRDGESFVIDRAGQIVFRSEWRSIKPFSEGMAAVRRDDLWGFVDAAGRVVIEPTYSSVTRFAEGLAGVELGRSTIPFGRSAMLDWPGRRGFIDQTGHVVIPIALEDVQPFSHGRATVCLGSTLKANPLLDGRETPSERRYGLIDRSGSIVVDGRYGGIGPFSEGLAVVHTGDAFVRGRYGYIDADGREVIPRLYSDAGSFRQGLAMVQRRGRKNRSLKFLIDRTGNVFGQIDRQFSFEGFREGLTAAYFGALWGVIDVTGRTVIEPQFDDVGPFTDGLAAVSRGKWNALIDRSGRIVWGPTEAWIYTSHGTAESEWA